MLYYNLHQLLWSNTLTGYQRSINCACIEEITIESNTTEPILVSRKVEDYKAKGIPIESYLAHNLEVSNSHRHPQRQKRFIICNENALIPTELTITDGAQLNLYAEKHHHCEKRKYAANHKRFDDASGLCRNESDYSFTEIFLRKRMQNCLSKRVLHY
jgi:hypothetical protein